MATLPFDAAYKMMATFHAMKDATGAPVIRGLREGRARSASRPRDERSRPRRRRAVPIAQIRDAYLAENERLGTHGPASHGDRPEGLRPGNLRPVRPTFWLRIDGLTLLAIVGIVDPPRPAAKAAIAEAHAAGHPGPDDHRRPRCHR